MVYVREAHPSDGKVSRENERVGIEVLTAQNEEDRAETAKTCGTELKMTMPFLLDDMNDTAEKAYDGWPDRIFVVDTEGKIAYRGAQGPKGFKPDEAVEVLKKLLEPKKDETH